VNDDRLERAQGVIQNLYGKTWQVERKPGEPKNASDLIALLLEHTYTDSWSRTGLDVRTKSLTTVAMMIALGNDRELRAHVSGALAVGVSADELVEVLIHALGYCGAGRVAPAWSSIRSLLAEAEAGD
jgi:4-carboxymuconolactone decarboxylase